MSDTPALPTLPDGWIWAPLGDLADVKLGKMLSPKAFAPGLRQLPYLRNENVRWFSIDTDDVKSMGFTDDEREKFRLCVGDLLVCEGGEPGRCAVVTESTANFMIQKALHRVRPRDGAVDARFLQYFFKRFIDAGTAIERRSETTIQHLPREKMLRVHVPVAPVSEQRRIVAKIEELFSDLDAGVAALERVRANLKRYRAAVLKAAVEGRLTEEWRARNPDTEPASVLLERILAERRAKWEQDQIRKFKEAGKSPPKGWREKYKAPARPSEVPSVLPSTWAWASLDEVCHRITDGTHLPPKFVDAGVPFVFVKHIVGGSISFDRTRFISQSTFEELNERCPIERGDVLYSAVGSYGVAVPVETSVPFSFQRHIAHLKPSRHFSYGFLVHSLNSDTCLSQAHRLARGVAQKTVTLGDLSKFNVPVAPGAEQAEIVAEVDRRLSVADAAEKEVERALQRAARLRQAILKRAFEGRLVPQVESESIESRAAVEAPLGYLFNAAPDFGPAMAVASMLVDELGDDPKCGRIKLTKLLYMAHAHAGVETGFRWGRQAAGPFDPAIYELEKHAARERIFSSRPRDRGGLQYIRGPRLASEVDAARGVLGDRYAGVRTLLKQLAPLDMEGAELLATVYAAWNDLLIDGRALDDDAIVAEVRGWHESKKRFKPRQIKSWIDWLRVNSMVPTGRGRRTESPTRSDVSKQVDRPVRRSQGWRA